MGMDMDMDINADAGNEMVMQGYGHGETDVDIFEKQICDVEYRITPTLGCSVLGIDFICGCHVYSDTGIRGLKPTSLYDIGLKRPMTDVG